MLLLKPIQFFSLCLGRDPPGCPWLRSFKLSTELKKCELEIHFSPGLVGKNWMEKPRIFLWLIMGCFMAMIREKGVNTTIFGRSHVSKLHGLSDIHSVTFQLYWEQCIPAWQVEWQTTSNCVCVIGCNYIYICVCDGKVKQWGFRGMVFALWSFQMGMNKLCLFINPCWKLCQQKTSCVSPPGLTTKFKQTCVNLLFIWAL